MKRHNNIYQQICSIENLQMADAIAQMGKQKRFDVIRHKKKAESNIEKLHHLLVNKTYQVSPYTVFVVKEHKERTVYRLPYFPDMIIQQAIMNVIEPILVSTFTADTYACIKGRGVHKASNAISLALKDLVNTQYCLQVDVKKFYPSVDNEVLRQLLRRKFKDNDFLWLMDVIIDSAVGLPIGNFLSQSLSTFYLSQFDHWIKEQKRVKYYFRYVDDIIILGSDKSQLHGLRKEIELYLQETVKLQLKSNWRVFPVKCGIDAFGYKDFGTHKLLRKRVKQAFARAVKKGKGIHTLASYKGWAKHCNSRHLLKKLLPHEQL